MTSRLKYFWVVPHQHTSDNKLFIVNPGIAHKEILMSIKIKKDPRISVNALCEYALASPSKRLTILKKCKKPVPYITNWYNQAEDVLSFYLAEIRDDVSVLKVEAGRLRSKKAISPMDKKFNNACADALQAFIKDDKSVRNILSPYKPEIAVNDTKHKFIVNGVQISLRPELILRDLQGKQQLGFVKFYFGKNEELTQEKGELIACLTKYYFEQEYGFTLKSKDCLVLDVYRGEMYSAPNAYKRAIANIKAALSEILDRWDKI